MGSFEAMEYPRACWVGVLPEHHQQIASRAGEENTQVRHVILAVIPTVT